ncbi:MAG: TRAP transporter 4TM/12TM fusion protein [Kiritimatiellia bacterium]|jgi:TRAP transporter 4TM/12TM fusion protein
MEKGLQATYKVLAVFLCVFTLFGVNTTILDQTPNLAIFSMLGLILVFIQRPFLLRAKENVAIRLVDVVLCLLVIFAFGYVCIQNEPRTAAFWTGGSKLGDRAGSEVPMDFAVGLIGIILVLEATRRTIGWTLPILCGIFILYAFFGASMPDWLFPHRGFDWQRVVSQTFIQNGVFGIALRVMFLYVFLFVLFGTLLEETGATGYIINLARRIFRKSPGGPAKVAVLSSGLMGSLSGSAVANTATTGTFTIPLMKSAGFKPETAAGVEAAASSGGALMPPIMGAGAYMMLEMVEPEVKFLEIIRAAIIPAVLYYIALLLSVHFQAKKIGAGTEPPDAEGLSDMHPFQGVVFFSSFVILIALLVKGFTPFLSVSWALVAILALSAFSSSTRVNLKGVFAAMIRAARSGVTLIAAASCVGIILGIVYLTGVGTKLPNAIQPLAQNSTLLALVLMMVSTIILGMGLPSAVCYLLMATLIGTVLPMLGTAPLAAHLFIFYFGMMSMVTPPVALAAYTAAAIAKSDTMKSGFAAFRFALVGFALPYAFVLRPELIMLQVDGSPAAIGPIIANVATALVAITGLAASMTGFAFTRLTQTWRIPLLAASLVIFFTRFSGVQLIAQLTATVLIILLLGTNWMKARSA